MIKILFICHGNICRSPMAQMMFQNKVNMLGMNDSFLIDSKAASSEEIGNPIYPPALKTLKNHNIPIISHKAIRFESYDYEEYDFIITMDKSNINRLKYIHEDSKNKYRLLASFSRQEKEVEDPWYTRDFETCYNDIDKYLDGFIKYLKRYKKF